MPLTLSERDRHYQVWVPRKEKCDECRQMKRNGRAYAVAVYEGPKGKPWSDKTVASGAVCSETCAKAWAAHYNPSKGVQIDQGKPQDIQ